ncbi:MAG: methyltransferase domain-containing protein [Dehalococcoidia bacterium]|jgi:ubiquinone/menaquinone biosynthesis C-methylase UbiE|nr:methyltransferase domain-containing protein [Dehalococcoidia bacterium]
MPRVFWTGKLSLPVRLMVDASSLVAWATGAMRDTEAMKARVKQGYDGVFSDHVSHYDEVGADLQARSALEQLKDVDVRGKLVLDIGGGTGVASFLMLRRGAARVVCGDISERMLACARAHAEQEGFGPDRIEFRQLDAEALPYDDDSFDVVSTSMTMGLLPDQKKAVVEMERVARPGGLVSIGTHAPEHYWEPTDTGLRAMSKRYVFGYRLEFWPQTESEVRDYMRRAGLENILSRRVTWHTDFGSGGKAYDFFAAISASWWYGRFPPEKVQQESDRTRAFFERTGARIVTDDIIVASGTKSAD